MSHHWPGLISVAESRRHRRRGRTLRWAPALGKNASGYVTRHRDDDYPVDTSRPTPGLRYPMLTLATKMRSDGKWRKWTKGGCDFPFSSLSTQS